MIEELILENYRLMMAAAMRVLRCPMAAEDAVQEACVRALKYHHTVKDVAGIKPWLYLLAHRTALDMRPATARNRRYCTTAVDPEIFKAMYARPALNNSMGALEDYPDVAAMVARLPVKLQQAVVLTARGHKNPAIAKILDIPLSTVEVRLVRARVRLHELMYE